MRTRQPPRPARPGPSGDASRSNGPAWLPAIDGAATVLAPITVLTALLASFGYARTRAYYGYFGIGQGLLDLPLEAYVLRSAGIAFGGGAALVGGSILLLALDQGIHLLRNSRPHRRTALLRGVITVGLVATAAGLYFALGGYRPAWLPPIAPPILLAAGSAAAIRWMLIAHAEQHARTRRPLHFPRRAALATLTSAILVAVFWATTLYAEDIGRRTAIRADQAADELPLVTLFSTEFLDIPADPRFTARIALEGEPVRYRYGGLRLLTYSNERWFLLSGRHSDFYKSSVVVLHDTDSVRVEIADPSSRSVVAPPAAG